jgi:RNA polymerase sigma-70 factor (ECF subfamily)
LIFSRKTESLSDLELVVRYQKNGDKQLVGMLYKRYTGFVFAVCLKYLRSRTESEDAVMQIFEKLFDDLLRHSPQHFKSWLYTVAKNHCLHIIRDKKKDLGIEDLAKNNHPHLMEIIPIAYHDDEDILEQRIGNLEQELHKLSEEQRICIELFYLKQKSYNEVSSITGYTLGQVKSYIQNGKRNLKISLKGNE